MDDSDDMAKVSRNLNYSIDESAAVFRITWYSVASKPNVLLEEYSEAESQVFNGAAKFSLRIAGEKAQVNISVDGAKSSVGVEAEGKDEVAVGVFLDDLVNSLNDALSKYDALPNDDKAKLKRALVAKTCWDRVVREILNKSPLSDVYIQVAHGREMMIKATEGEDGMHPLTLTTSGWLSTIESLPRDETLPGNIASELAKKSIEWKRETHEVISRYI
ncbi:MAG: putative selenocysteine system protein [Candidatus Thorarchaeota archaeon]